jgi:hypothetical protein
MFKECDWKEYYPGATEAIPDNMPELVESLCLQRVLLTLIMLDVI